MKKIVSLFILHFSLLLIAQGAVRLPSIIGSHMVLQQKSNVKLWGWASPGEKVKISVGWDTTTYTGVTTRGAKWEVDVKTPAAGGPYAITIKGNNQVVLDDVLIGEVWVCSGQSNMEWSADQGLQQSKDESPNATNKQIRFFYVAKSTSEFPQDDLTGKWVVCNPEDMLHFSAVGYFFGKEINAKTGFPVGLINSNWGGTPAEVWTPGEVVKQDNDLRAASAKLEPTPWWPYVSGQCYNAMIHPLTKLAIAGTIWYQGESNVGMYYAYEKLFTSMIESWRKAWGKEFPFYFVQIAPYAYGDDQINGALLREAQTRSTSLKQTGMVVVSDLVNDVKNIHPIDKINVSKRLANYALAETYGNTGVNYKSPTYRAHTTEKGKIRVSFNDVPSTLMSKNGAELTDFYIAGEDNKYVPAVAKIEGKTVVVSSKDVKDPISVRFGFNNTATPNLVTAEGLPVNLFRTDK